MPIKAKLLLSVAPLVNVNSLSKTLNISLTCFKALFKRAFDLTPKLCRELGLPGKSYVALK